MDTAPFSQAGCFFLHMSNRKPYAEEKHIAGTLPDTMAVLVGVFRGQPPVPGPLLV